MHAFFWGDGPWFLIISKRSILDGRSAHIGMVQLLKLEKKKKVQTTRTVESLPLTVRDTEAQGDLREEKELAQGHR